MIGQTISHYRILEKVGGGGMGVVYRAHDEQLDRDVALKVLPAGTLADEAARRQFRKEALALAKLNHPNIETVFEFSSQNGIDFLAMELIGGSTLSERLKEGPLPEREVLQLGIQFVEALAAAHEQGVVHRDLKPSNVIITPDGRLKILDFGLAKFVHPTLSDDVTQTITTDGSTISGTIPYMSPEQLSGLPLDGRSDIYSAGVVLYEMAGGSRPFREAQSARLIGAILHRTPAPLRSVNQQVSPGLESVINKTLEKQPGQRYQSARELRAAIEGISMATASLTGTPVLAPAPTPSRTLIAICTGLSLVLVLGIGLGLNVRGLRDHLLRRASTQQSYRETNGPIQVRRSVAVLGFKNVSGRADEAWMSTALSDMLTTELAAGEQLRTVPSENVAEMKISLSLPDADSYGQETLQKIHKNLNADNVVVGSYIPMGKGQIRLDLRLQDAVNGGILAAVSEKGSETEMDDLVSRAGAELRAKLGAGSVSALEAAEVRAARSSNPEAEKLYSEGLADLGAFDNLKAKELLQKAIDVDPHFALAHSALASAWKGLGYDEKAKDEAKKAFDLSGGLERADRLRVEGQYREMANEWDKAAEIYRTLFQFFPDNLEYGILLARSQTRAGTGKDAMATAESLRKLPPPSGGDPRINLMAADASASLGDFAQERSFAGAAADEARTRGAKLVLARALYLSSSADENLSRTEEANVLDEESAALYEAAGDRNGVASTVEVSADLLADRGDLAGAIAKYNQELAIVREVGNKRAESSALNNLALVVAQQGDLAAAKKLYGQALATFREIDDKNNSAMALINIGGVLKDQGDLVGAKGIYEQALSVSREVSDNNGVALALCALGTVLDAQGEFAPAKKVLDQALAIDLENGRKTPSGDKLVDLGDLLQHQGDLADAAKSYHDGLELSRAADDKSTAAYALFGLGNLAVVGADFAGAKQDFDEALALRNELGEKENADATRVALARLAIEQGHAEQAAAFLREAGENLRKTKRVDDEVAATCLLVRALLALGDVADARRELEGVAATAGKNQNLGARLDFAIVSALVQAASGKVSLAKRNLKTAIAEATKTSFLSYEFEARLALAEIDLKSPHATETRAQLEQLQREANEKGFDLVARKAASL
jgi:eukaryotic-like serine/threonine-protein kinase